MNVRVERINSQIGANVYLNRSDLLRTEMTELLLSLLEERTVVVMPKIGLTDEEQLALTDSLGKRLNIAAQIPGRSDAPPIFQVTLDKGARIEPEYVLGTFFWHMDGLTINGPPPKATVLSARKVSKRGGQTQFAGTEVAYEKLSAEEQSDLRKLRVVHTVTAAVREFAAPDALDDARRALRKEHPLVWTRRNGKRSLIVGYTADQVVDMPQAEGRALLLRLLEWTAQPAFTYSHDWSEGDCVIWDNTRALHRVVPYAADSGRMMHRTTIAGVEAVA